MDIGEENVSAKNAEEWLEHCIKFLNEAKEFEKGIDWDTLIVPCVTLEEIIGALIAARMKINCECVCECQ